MQIYANLYIYVSIFISCIPRTDSEHVINVTDINPTGQQVQRKTQSKPQPDPAFPDPSLNSLSGGDTDDLVPGKPQDDSQMVDNKTTVIPNTDEPHDDQQKDAEKTNDADGDGTGTEAGKHSELLKLGDEDGDRPVDSVQYPKPGPLQRKLAAIERPQSVPQKAVHFLDEEPKSEARHVQRSKSAHPRITGRERSKERESAGRNGSGTRRKPAPVDVKCKAEVLGHEGVHRKDQDDDEGAGNGSDCVPMGSDKGVAPPQGEDSRGSGGGEGTGTSDNSGSQGKQQGLQTWTGMSANWENREKQQTLGLQEAIIITASGGRQNGQLVADASNALVIVPKNPTSVEKSQTSKAADGKPLNGSSASKPPRKPRAKTASPAVRIAQKHADTKRSRRPHTAHSSSVTLDLGFTHDPKQEIVAHGDLCFVGSEPVVTRTKIAPASATKKRQSEKTNQFEKGAAFGDIVKVGVCSGCCKTSMLVGDRQQALCTNCLLKVNAAKTLALEASESQWHAERGQNLRKSDGEIIETIVEDASNDSDYGSNSDDTNTFMTSFCDLEESLLLTRQEIQAEMKRTQTESDVTSVAVDDDDSEADRCSDDSHQKDAEDEVLARCYEECLRVIGRVGEISEFLTNTEYYRSVKTKQCSEPTVVHKAPTNQASAKTTGRSEAEFGKDVKSGDVSSYEVMLMRDYSTNVDVPTEDEEEEETPFLEMVCQSLPEPAKVRQKLTLDTGHWILDTGYLTLDTAYLTLDTAYLTLDTAYLTLVT